MNNLTFDLAKLQTTQAKLPSAVDRKLDEAAKDFESVFLTQMLQTVWDTVPTDGPMGGGSGESIFRSMMIQDIGRQISNQGGIGLATYIKAELLNLQEGKKK